MSTSHFIADLLAALVALHARVWQNLPELTVSWLCTYAVHSTLLIGTVWLIVTRFRLRSQLVRDTLWKVALVGTIVTTSWQVASGVRPFGLRLDLQSRVHVAENPTHDLTQLAAVPIEAWPAESGPFETVSIDAVPIESIPDGTLQRNAGREPALPGDALATSDRPTSLNDTEPGLHRSGDLSLVQAATTRFMTRQYADAGWDRSAIWSQASAPRRGSRPIRLGARGATANEIGGERQQDRARRYAANLQSATSSSLQALGAGASRIAGGARWLARVWPQVVLIAWAAGGTLGLLRLAALWFCIYRRIGRRQRITSGPLLPMLEELRRHAGLTQPIRISCSERISGPIALGLDEICVPERVLTALSPAQQRGVLAHELAHLKRRDPLWLQLSGVVGALLFFQPLNRLVSRQMRDAAEYLCDDWAVQQSDSRLSMARSLAEVASWIESSPRPIPVTSMAERNSALVRRIQRVLEEQHGISSRFFVWLQAPLAALMVLAIALLAPGVSAIDLPWQREAGGARADEVQLPPQTNDRLVIRHAARDDGADRDLDETTGIGGSPRHSIVIGPDSGVDHMPMLATSQARDGGDREEWTDSSHIVTTGGRRARSDWSAHRDHEDHHADDLAEQYAHQAEQDDHARFDDRRDLRDRWDREDDWDERDERDERHDRYDRYDEDDLESARRAYERSLQRFEAMNERLSSKIASRLEPRMDDLDDEIEEMLEPQLDRLEEELSEILEPVLERIGERLETRIEEQLEATLEEQLPALLALELSELDLEFRPDQRVNDLDAVLELYVERIGEQLEEALADEIEEMIDAQLESLERDIEDQLDRITR